VMYNKAQTHNGVVYVSGQVGVLPGTMTLAPGGVKAQTRQALQNLAGVLKDSGSSLEKVLKTTCYLSSIDDYDAFNEAYREIFDDGDTRPARVCIGAGGLPLGALVEVEATAVQKRKLSVWRWF